MYKVAIDPKEWKVSTKNTKKLREEARKERLKKGKKEVAESPKGKTGKEKKGSQTARFLTEYLEIDSDHKIRCKKCGHVFCDADKNYKLYALKDQVSPFARGGETSARPKDDNWCVFREYYCPGCAVLLNVDPCLPDDPITWDARLK